MPRLAKVKNPAGRLDVLLYNQARRGAEMAEREGIRGAKEHLLPIVEESIKEAIPPARVVPPAVRRLLRFYTANRGGGQ